MAQHKRGCNYHDETIRSCDCGLHLRKPSPYSFKGERERIAAHDARFADARDNNGNQPTCPYCYQTARVRLVNGKRGLYCGCVSQ